MKLPKIVKQIGYLFKESFNHFVDDNAITLSASLSYYTIFSLPPLLVIIISLSAIFFGAEAVNGEIFGLIHQLMGNQAALQIQDILKNIKLSNTSVSATTIGIIILLIGASGVFVEIQDSINYIWGIKAKPKRGLIRFMMNRIMSFAMIGSLGFILLVSLIINYLLYVLHSGLLAYFPNGSIYLFYVLNIIVMFTIITILFVFIFRTLPDGKVPLRDCLIGSSFSALLFMAGRYVVGLYLSNLTDTSIYGAAGSIILIMIWIYYSSIILYFGAEFTKVYANTQRHTIVPNKYSVKIIKQTEAEPGK